LPRRRALLEDSAGVDHTTMLVPALPGAAITGATKTEGGRQLDRARVDLGMGNVDRAIHAARSVRRLDPSLVESLLVQAQASEFMGDRSQARILTTAYLGDSGAAADVAVALVDRLDRAEPVQASVEGRDCGTQGRIKARAKASRCFWP
jgi:hypothetical protein